MIDKRQIAAARALLGWTQIDLAEKAEIGVASVKKCEKSLDVITPVILRSIRLAFEQEGIEFINTSEFVGLKRKLPASADK